MSAAAPRTAAAPRAAAAPRTRLSSLTGLRFVAAFGVFVAHANEYGVTMSAIDDRFGLFNLGVIGVSVFFVLSGLVLVWSRIPGDAPSAFFRRRFARIVPDHLVAWALGLVVAAALAHKAVSAGVAAATLLLVQAWVPDAHVYYGNNTLEWTLACEVFFYACFPVAVVLLARLDARGRRRALLALLAAVVALDVAAWLPGHLYGGRGVRVWLVLICPLARLPEFLIGMLLGLELRAGGGAAARGPALWHAAVAGVLAVAWLVAFPWQWGPGVTIVPVAMTLWALAVADVRGRGTVLARRRLVVLGEWSFAFYLLHQLVLRVLVAEGATAGRLGHVPFFLLALVLSVIAAGALFTLVERPAERRLRGTARPRAELEPAVAAI